MSKHDDNDDDESFDEEDEVPLSKLIPQVQAETRQRSSQKLMTTTTTTMDYSKAKQENDDGDEHATSSSTKDSNDDDDDDDDPPETQKGDGVSSEKEEDDSTTKEESTTTMVVESTTTTTSSSSSRKAAAAATKDDEAKRMAIDKEESSSSSQEEDAAAEETKEEELTATTTTTNETKEEDDDDDDGKDKTTSSTEMEDGKGGEEESANVTTEKNKDGKEEEEETAKGEKAVESNSDNGDAEKKAAADSNNGEAKDGGITDDDKSQVAEKDSKGVTNDVEGGEQAPEDDKINEETANAGNRNGEEHNVSPPENSSRRERKSDPPEEKSGNNKSTEDVHQDAAAAAAADTDKQADEELKAGSSSSSTGAMGTVTTEAKVDDESNKLTQRNEESENTEKSTPNMGETKKESAETPEDANRGQTAVVGDTQKFGEEPVTTEPPKDETALSTMPIETGDDATKPTVVVESKAADDMDCEFPNDQQANEPSTTDKDPKDLSPAIECVPVSDKHDDNRKMDIDGKDTLNETEKIESQDENQIQHEVYKPIIPRPVDSESEEEEGEDPFEELKKIRPQRTRKKTNAVIKMQSLAIFNGDQTRESFDKDTRGLDSTNVIHVSEEESETFEQEFEDSLNFFREPHEDQDPAYAEFQQKQKERMVSVELKKLEAKNESGRKEIESIVSEQYNEKQASTERSVEKYKMKIAAEERRDMERLEKSYTEKSNSNTQKINQGMQMLRKRHLAETQKYMQHHRNKVQQRRIPEQMAQAEWSQLLQRLKQKHQQQLNEFSAKGEDVKKRCEVEYQKEGARLREQREKRLRDVDANRKNILNKLVSGFQQLRQRYLKRHHQMMMRKKEGMVRSLKSTPDSPTKKEEKSLRDSRKSISDEKIELRPPSPIKTCEEWFKDSPYEKSGAAARHKHRKGVLSQINKQLSVEIHNEGIWISQLPDKKSDEKDSSQAGNEKRQFVPWSVKARELLESIICGEIPQVLGSDYFDFGETAMVHGGHIRCVMTDLRTSDETASVQRAAAVQEKEQRDIQHLLRNEAEMKAAALQSENLLISGQKQIQDATRNLELAARDVENKKKNLQAFRTKFSRYLNPDGTPSASATQTDRQKLLQATQKYKSAVENSEKRQNAIRAKLNEAKAQSQKQQAFVKEAQRAAIAASAAAKRKKALQKESRSKLRDVDETELASIRVKDTIAALSITADKRRDQLNQKRNSSTSSTWVQTLPGLPGPLRKSLWYKMHRRRQQIVLRPSLESLRADLRRSVSKKLLASGLKNDALEAELLKAEQSFLLAIHPVAPAGDPLPSVPSSTSWAEPGWHLVLDAPTPRASTILPCAEAPALVQKNLSELHSAPGLQAAALIKTTHLRSLASPLSAVATATSLAETNPSVAVFSDAMLSEIDPLRSSERSLMAGYKFTLPKPQPMKPVSKKRPISSIKDQTPGSTTSRMTKKNPSLSSIQHSEQALAAKATGGHVQTAQAKPQRKRKSAAGADSSSRQRRKSEPKLLLQQQQQQVVNLQARNVMQQQTPDQSMLTNRASVSRQQSIQGQQNQFNQYNTQMQAPAPQQQVQQRASFQQQMFQQQQQQQFQPPQQQYQPPQQQYQPPPQQQQQLYQTPQQQQQQFQTPQQMAQLRMMQQQQQTVQQQTVQQQVGYAPAPHGMQQMPQFFPQMPQQQFAQPMGMPGQLPPGQMPMNLQGGAVRKNTPTGDDQNDPLFMLKDM